MSGWSGGSRWLGVRRDEGWNDGGWRGTRACLQEREDHGVIAGKDVGSGALPKRWLARESVQERVKK